MEPWSTDSRPLLAKDTTGNTYISVRMDCEESVNGSFSAKVKILAPDIIECEPLLGTSLAISYTPDQAASGTKTYFHGLILAMEQQPPVPGAVPYLVTLCSWFDLLACSRSCRVFQKVGIDEIFDTVLTGYSFEHSFRFTSKPSVKRETCIQFNETDMDFLQRLLYEEGLFFFFEHTEAGHEMVIGATNQDFPDAPCTPVQLPPAKSPDQACVNSWFPHTQIGASPHKVASWNTEQAQPLAGRVVKSPNTKSHGLLSEGLEWNGRFLTEDELNTWAERQTEQSDSSSLRASAESELYDLHCGMKLSHQNHYDATQNQEYVVLSVRHEFKFGESFGGDSNQGYINELQLQASAIPVRMHTIPKPVIPGIQTATVFNADDKECAADDQARVEVVFHWDKDSSTPCWIPVARSLAGDQFGMHLLPRTGQEVVICYIDGDPDRPVIMATLHNGANKPAETSAEVIQFTSHSTPDGGAEDCHIFKITDTKDSEELMIQAQKDMNVTVKNNMTTTVTAEHVLEVEKNSSVTVKEDITCKTDGALNAEIAKAIALKGNDALTIEAGKALALNSKDALTIEATKAATLKTNDAFSLDCKESSLKAQSKIVIEAPQGITFKAGTSEIQLTPSGIVINGMKVAMEAKTTMEMKALTMEQKATVKAAIEGLMLQLKGSTLAQVEGSAMFMAKGGISMIN